MHKPAHHKRSSRLGHWLPADRKVLNAWLAKTREAAEKKTAPVNPVILELQETIEGDPVLLMYFTQMFEQQPSFAPPPDTGDIKIRDYHELLQILDHVLTTAPEFTTAGMVGCPINAVLDFPMITPAGLAAFTSAKLNRALKKVLTVWAQFLDSPASLYVLNETPAGWLCPAALQAIHMDEYVHDPKAPFYGFRSWNDFFIRRFKPGTRPIAEPHNPKAIVSACESAPFAIATNVKVQDAFWIKSQPYSLLQMLDGQFVDEFLGGTVYQAFLSAENYHRWHSPVSGTIKMIRHVEGAYYAEAAEEGFDPLGPNNSQGYIAHVNTRALIFIEADEAGIGLLCFVAVGMAEVSSCMLSVKQGEHVKKGDEIGFFQFGGSSHCLVFRRGAVAAFALQSIPQGERGANSPIVKVNSLLAMA
ncbi:MAG TPA: phosphatidylserine decarboxylase family protein [Bryobacteraceae bacterium]